MKVLVAASTFPRWQEDRLPDFVWRQVRHLRAVRPDMDVAVLAPHHAGSATAERWDGVEIRRFRYAWPATAQRLAYPAIWPNLRAAPWLFVQVPLLLAAEFIATVRWLRREPIALVYSHWFMPQGVACGMAALLTGTPHAFTSHSSDVAVMRRLPAIGPWLVRFLTRRARAITAVSSRSRAVLESFFEQDEWQRIAPRVAVIPMGVELDDAVEDSEDAKDGSIAEAGSARARLLFLGRLVEKKGVADLLRALATPPLRDLPVRLDVGGDGPLEGELRALAATLGLDTRVCFHGFVTGRAKQALLRAADVVVIPSIVTPSGDAEGLPVVLLEALAAGKICVATDASGAEDVVRPDVDALIVPQQDPAALAAAIARAVQLPDNEQRRLRDAARHAARPFDWPTIARAYARHLLPPA